MSLYEVEARQLIADRPGFAREVARIVNSSAMGKLSSTATGGLTGKQRDLLLYIRKYIGEHGIAPSFDEMKAAQGLASKSGIHRMITGLEERGFITRLPDRARAIRLAVPT